MTPSLTIWPDDLDLFHLSAPVSNLRSRYVTDVRGTFQEALTEARGQATPSAPVDVRAGHDFKRLARVYVDGGIDYHNGAGRS